MNWEILCPDLSFTVENILLIYIKWRCSHFKYNDWDIPLIQVVTIYQWIEKNKFSIGKNGILSPLRILLIPQNFWPQKRPWIFKSTIWCFPPADNMLNENTSSTSLNFMISRELNICKVSRFFVWSGKTLGMYFSAGGWLYL